jgi:2-C-methyl-D-erythritol 4-phosphate cytidylyltransferase
MPQEYALIVAGGKGTRFGGPLPKQFQELRGKPVLLRTIEAFRHYSAHIQIVLVLPADQFSAWKEITSRYQVNYPIVLQEGGATRFQSVRNGLQRITSEGYVAIHDGVRPLVSTEIIEDSFKLARLHGAAIATVPLKESLREVTGGETRAVDRSSYRMVQTPQTFEVSMIRKAYELPEDESLTDDASVAERAGYAVHLFDGDYRNIKITHADDLVVAEALLASDEAKKK